VQAERLAVAEVAADRLREERDGDDDIVQAVPPEQLEPLNRALAEAALATPALDYVGAVLQMQRYARRVAAFWDDVDVVLTPGLGVKSRLVPPGASEATLERADALSAYVIETIREDAMGARPGTHLEVTLPAEASTVDLASVRDALAGLGRRGIAVSVRCDAPVSAAIPGPPATEGGGGVS